MNTQRVYLQTIRIGGLVEACCLSMQAPSSEGYSQVATAKPFCDSIPPYNRTSELSNTNYVSQNRYCSMWWWNGIKGASGMLIKFRREEMRVKSERGRNYSNKRIDTSSNITATYEVVM